MFPAMWGCDVLVVCVASVGEPSRELMTSTIEMLSIEQVSEIPYR